MSLGIPLSSGRRAGRVYFVVRLSEVVGFITTVAQAVTSQCRIPLLGGETGTVTFSGIPENNYVTKILGHSKSHASPVYGLDHCLLEEPRMGLATAGII